MENLLYFVRTGKQKLPVGFDPRALVGQYIMVVQRYQPVLLCKKGEIFSNCPEIQPVTMADGGYSIEKL